MPNLGLIGCGNMGRALVRGWTLGSTFDRSEIYVSDGKYSDSVKTFCEEYLVSMSSSNLELVRKCDIIVLAVKPHSVGSVFESLGNARVSLTGKLVISILAGVSVEKLRDLAKDDQHSGIRWVRCMPNTPALLSAGITAFALSSTCLDDDVALVERVLQGAGSVLQVKESQLNAVTGLSGSGPAYVYTFIESLAAGGVLAGLTSSQALTLAVQTTLGAARMVDELHESPAVLRDMVCTPGGTTIHGVHALEQNNFRFAVMEAVRSAAERSKAMGED